jgi:hypothetical protein
VDGADAERAGKGERFTVRVPERVRQGDKLYKVEGI